MDIGVEDDTAVVAASTSGLGFGVARAFATEGANVVVNGRDEERLREARTELEAVGTGDVATAVGDLTDPDAVETPVSVAVERFGSVDHLVTNCGGVPSGPFSDLTDEEWQTSFELLVMSVVRLIRAARPHLTDGGGTITAITARSVKEPNESMVLSSSIRPCVAGLIKTLSRELAPTVRANVVCPGPHETPGIRTHIEDGVARGTYESYEAGMDELTGDVPLGRAGDVSCFGEVVAFLCSRQAAFVTGEALLIDGGSCRSML